MNLKLNDFEVNKNIPIPLYYQLKQQLLEKIMSNEIKVNEQLSNEVDLAEELGISRSTVRQAISELVCEGYFYRVKAKGTFVSKPKVDESFLQKLDSFNSEMCQKGLNPTTSVLALKTISGKEEINRKLNVLPESKLIYLSRLRYADNAPVVYVETYIPYNDCVDLLGMDFSVKSLYTELENRYNIRIQSAVRQIEAVNAAIKEAKLLGVKKNAAICLVKTTAFTTGDVPVEFSVARYRGDLNKFSVELFRRD